MEEYQKKIDPHLRSLHGKRDANDIFNLLQPCFHRTELFDHEDIKCFFCESSEVVTRLESVLLAKLLIEKKFKNIFELQEKVESRVFKLKPSELTLQFFYSHLDYCLKLLVKKPKLQKRILQFSNPLFNPWSEKIIKTSLNLSQREKITHTHIQALVLSAWFHPLRQNVGSCFATAPAILIQREQPELFFNDMEDLLNMGALKRTFEGHEHAIPISTSWGPGILNKSITITQEIELWQSSEILFCLKELQIISHDLSLTKQHKELRKIMEKAFSFPLNTKVSLRSIIKKILLSNFRISEKELSLKALQVINPNHLDSQRLELNQPSSQKQSFEDTFQKAQYSLISFHEHPLLKTWEYTLASFAETESQFFKWNLYVSLGFDSKKENSVASCIYHYLEKKLKDYQEKIKFHAQEYEQEYFRVKMLEKRVFDSQSENSASWAKVEYQNHLNEFNFHKNMRDGFIGKSEDLSKLLTEILKIYDSLLPRYFQEIYDASMQEVTNEIYEDSPAGFRLLYKHGRADPSLWSFVQSKEEFINYLKEFFVHTEFEISSHEKIEPFKQEYSEIVTELVQLIQEEKFILAAYQRIADRYQLFFPKDDLSQLDKWPYQPWCYISGGTMERLLRHYYKRESLFSTKEQRVATPTELLSFIIETIQDFSAIQIEDLSIDTNKNYLMYSPNHAFLFKPGWLPSKELWDQREYSYTWIRDRLVYPQLKWIQSQKISLSDVNYFFDHFLGQYPYFSVWLKQNIDWPSHAMTVKDFREKITSCLEKSPATLIHRSVSVEQIDSWIFSCFPLISVSELYPLVHRLIYELFDDEQDQEKAHWVLSLLIKNYQPFPSLPNNELSSFLKIMTAIVYEKKSSQVDWSEKILFCLRQNNLVMPPALAFADTNWPYLNFAFLVNPATENLELWRMNISKDKGFPMHQWAHFFSENNPSTWGILTNPSEYVSHV